MQIQKFIDLLFHFFPFSLVVTHLFVGTTLHRCSFALLKPINGLSIHWIIHPTLNTPHFNCMHYRSLHSNWDSIFDNNRDWRDKNMSMRHKQFLFNPFLFPFSLCFCCHCWFGLFFSLNPRFYFGRLNHTRTTFYVKFEWKPGLLPYQCGEWYGASFVQADRCACACPYESVCLSRTSSGFC